MSNTLLLLAIACILVAPRAGAATPADSTNVSWLAAVVKPSFDFETMKYHWSADSSAVVLEELVVDWRDATDTTDPLLKGHRIRRSINCLAEGSLAISETDSAKVDPLAAKITEIVRSGPIGVYRIVLPVRDAAGKPLAERPRGRIMVTVSAGKLVDRKYSIELTGQTAVELE